MPRFLPGSPSWQKPPPGSALDYSHPIMQARPTLLFPFNQGGIGSLNPDVLNPTKTFAVNGTAPTVTTGPWGQSIKFNGTNGFLRETTYVLPTTQCTVLLLTQVGASGGAVSAFSPNITSSGADSQRCQVHLPFSGTVYWDFGGVSGSGGGRIAWTPSSAWFSNWHALTLLADSRSGGRGREIWSDGHLMAHNADTTARTATTAGIDFGGWANNSNLFYGGPIAFFCIVPIALAPGVIADWAENPYGVFLPSAPSRIWHFADPIHLYIGSGGAVSGGSATTTAAPRQYVGSGGAVSGGSATTTYTPVPFAIVQSSTDNAGNVSGVTVTLSATTAGTALFAVIAGGNSGSPATAVSLPSGFTLVGPSTPTAISGQWLAIAYRLNNPGGLTTFAFSETGGSAQTVSMIEVSGSSPVLRLDQVTYLSLSGTSEPLTGATDSTLFTPHELVVLGMTSGLGTPSLTPHGLFNATGSDFFAYSWGIAADTATSTAAVSATFTKNTGNSNTIGVITTFGVPAYDYIGSGGAVSGGSAAATRVPYLGTGGAVSGGAAITTVTRRGGGMPYRGRPPWQKPSPFDVPNPYRTDLSKLPRGVVDAWLLNEGAGSRIRSLYRSGVSGLLTGIKWSGGNGGPVLDLSANPADGSGSASAYAALGPTSYIAGGTELTYELLIKQAIGGSNETSIWRIQNTATVQTFGDQIRLAVFTTTPSFAGVFLTRTSSTIPNRWTLVHLTWGGGIGHIYFDGVEQPYFAQDNDTGHGTILSASENLRIGSAGDLTEPWPGRIAHNITWNRALSQTEVQQRVQDLYGFVRQELPRHTLLLSPVITESVRSVPQHAALNSLGTIRSVTQHFISPSRIVRSVPQFMLIFPDDLRSIPQTMTLQPVPRDIPQTGAVRQPGIVRSIPQFMLVVVDTKRSVPQHLALSPFVRSVPQHMQLSPANMRSITQQMRLRITLIRSVPQHFLPDYGGTTQAPRSVLQHAVLKLNGSHKPPKTNNRDVPQFLLASPKPRGVPQSGAISKVGITRFVLQAMTISLSAGVRSIPQSAAAGKLGTIRSVTQSVVAKGFGTVRSVPQHAVLNTVSGRFERPVPQHAVLSVPALVRLVTQQVATDRTAPLSRTVHQQTVVMARLIRSVTQHATIAVTHIRSVPQHAVLKATNIRSVPQHMQAGGTTVSQRGIPVVSIGKIPVVVVPSEPEVELSIK